MGVIMSLLFGTSIITGAWIGAVVVATYTMAEGMLAAVWTDLIQGILMVVMSLVVFVVAISTSGGWGNTLGALAAEDPALVSVSGVQPVTWIMASAIMIVFGAAGQPQLITKFLMLRDETQLRWGAVVAGVAYAVTTLFSLGVGLSVRAMVAEGSAPAIDNTATYFLGNSVNPVLGGLALTALLAAIMSSASSFITIGASSIMRDLAGGLRINVERELLWGRICSALVVLTALLFGLYLTQIIYLLGAFGWSAFAAAIFSSIVFGLYWKRATGVATTVTIAIGLGFNVVATVLVARGIITFPDYFFVGGVSVVLSMLVFIVVSYLTQSTKDEDGFAALYPVNDDAIDQSRQASLETKGLA